MDILYFNQVDIFCLVFSDSDFTRLAMRLREAGKEVIGMGMKKTPQPFIAACNKFIYIEVISHSLESGQVKEVSPESAFIVEKESVSPLKEGIQILQASDNQCSFVEDGAIIDRKLNVAITRARKQMIMTGNPEILRNNQIFSELMNYVKEKGGYF